MDIRYFLKTAFTKPEQLAFAEEARMLPVLDEWSA